MIAVGVGILVALVATVVFFVVYNSSRKGWQQSLAARESEAADLKVRNGVLEAQVKSCTARLAEVQAQLDFANREREKLNREKGDLQARNQMLSENMEVQKQEVQRIRQEMNNEFKVLANEILQEKSKSFSEMNHERLAEILNPLKERLEGFKKTVEETYNNEARERFSLKEQIKELVERSESIGAEAKQLTHALRGDSKVFSKNRDLKKIGNISYRKLCGTKRGIPYRAPMGGRCVLMSLSVIPVEKIIKW